MTEKKIQINLKAARQTAGLSLAQAASLTGVSKAMLHQIERGDSSPTLETLWKLAKGFHLPLTAFIEDVIQPGERISAAQAPPLRLADGLAVHTVFPFDPVFGSETFLITLQPGQSHLSQPHDTGVVEDLFVTQGSLELLIGETWTRHSCGEGIRFGADQPHGYRNPTGQQAQFHNTLYYPKTTLFTATATAGS